MIQKKCKNCGKTFLVGNYRDQTAKFCSGRCYGDWLSANKRGEEHPSWQEGGRNRVCNHCGKNFEWNGKVAISVFRKRKFCSKKCADEGGFRYSGSDHPNYRETARRRNRGGAHHKWTTAVISRDRGVCQQCGEFGLEVHAHHIKSYRDFPELRFDVSNGVTLCFKCHWAVHAALNAKAVNSGNIVPGHTGDNPEPSLIRNVQEGVTTRGRAYRRVVVPCGWCGTIVSKRLSDAKGKQALFCNKHCMGKWIWQKRHGSNTSTKTAPERDEIV